MDRTRFWVRFKDGRTATEQSEWVEPLDQLLGSSEVVCGWLDLEAPYSVDLEELQKSFGFSEHAIQDCRQFDQRAKLELFEGHSFWVCHGAVMNDTQGFEFSELHAFLTPKWCVTVHQGQIAPLDQLAAAWSSRPDLFPIGKGPAGLWMMLMDAMINQNSKALGQAQEQLEILDDEITGQLRSGQIEKLHHLKMALKRLRRLMAPQVDYLRSVQDGRSELACKVDRLQFRSVKDQFQLHVEKIDLSLEEIFSIRESYAVAATLASNQTMARLTAFSVVFLPLTFVTGFFGMNFEHLPVGDIRVLVGVIFFCLLSPFLVLLWVRRPS
ncbi:MAG: magnesium transporter CorA family protein [Oligoflexia bacterium]